MKAVLYLLTFLTLATPQGYCGESTPSYPFSKSSQIKQSVTQHSRVLQAIQLRGGYLNGPDKDLFELEGLVTELVKAIFSEQYPELFDDFIVVLINSESPSTMIYAPGDKSEPPLVFIDKFFIDRVLNLDELAIIVGHEGAHQVRESNVNSSLGKFERLVFKMEEERRTDTLGLALATAAGFNPQSAGELFERLMLEEVKVSEEGTKILNSTIFQTHPPNPIRITSLNLVTEELSEIYDFSEITDLPTEVLRAKEWNSLPERWPLSSILSQMAFAESPGVALEILGKNLADRSNYFERIPSDPNPTIVLTEDAGWTWNEAMDTFRMESANFYHGSGRKLRVKLSAAQVAEWLEVVFDHFRRHLTKDAILGSHNPAEHVSLVKVPEGVRGVEERFERMWGWLPEDLRKSKKIQNLFVQERELIRQKFAELNLDFDPPSTALQNILSVTKEHRSLSEVLASGASLSTWTDENRNHQRSYYKNTPKNWAFHLPLDLIGNPTSFTDSFENYIENAATYWSELEGHLSDSNFHPSNATVKSFIKIRDTQFALLASFLANGNDEVRQRIPDWQSKVAALDLPPVARFMLFPPFQMGEFRWGLEQTDDDRIEVSGSPIFEDSTEIFRVDQDQFMNFEDLKGTLQLIANGFEQPFDISQFSSFDSEGSSDPHSVSPGKWPINLSGFPIWINITLGKSTLSARQAWEILADRNFWESGSGRRYRTSSFYSHKAYDVNPVIAQRLQESLYMALKPSFGSLDREVSYWKAFASRAVTPLTDEWAQSLINRLAVLNTEEAGQLLNNMYASRLIWTLSTRLEAAYTVYSRSPLLRRIKRLAPGERDREIETLLHEIKSRFPEKSFERESLVNNLANLILANRAETAKMFAITGETLDLYRGQNKINYEDALGLRFYSQFVMELIAMEFDERTQYLDFLLGQTNDVPDGLRSENINMQHLVNETAKSLLENARLREDQSVIPFIAAVVGPFRLRRIFQSLPSKTRAAVLAPLMVDPTSGLPATQEGRDWIIQTLLPKDTEWKQMAVDLVDGYLEALEVLGQKHLKSLFISYLVASTATGNDSDAESLFPENLNSGQSNETSEGRILRILFQATTALTKIGQKVHSANILPSEINKSLGKLKVEADLVTRDVFFDWLDAASECENVCDHLVLTDPMGVASVKAHFGAVIDREEVVLGVVRPNASRKGDTEFALIEYAIKHAITKGHESLKLMLPLVQRARTTLAGEIDMNNERSGISEFNEIYQSNTGYGAGSYVFAVPSLHEQADSLLVPQRGYSVSRVVTESFLEMGPMDQQLFADAVVQKEMEVLLGNTEYIHYDKDRHEGNYMNIIDQDILSELGVSRAILAIDTGQISKIHRNRRDGMFEIIAIIVSLQNNLSTYDKLENTLLKYLDDYLISSAVPNEARDKIKRLVATNDKNPFEVLSSIMAHLESYEEISVAEPAWDFITALQTLLTWDQYLPKEKQVQTYLTKTIRPRVARHLGPLGKCGFALFGN